MRNFTGFDAPYEAPETPEIHLKTMEGKPEQMAERVVRHLIACKVIITAG
jgi:bifunctional enzyme CysN/CysC